MRDSETTFHCSKCNRGFKRLDLLHRHQVRNVCDGKGEEEMAAPYPASTSEIPPRRSSSGGTSSKRQKTTAYPSSSGHIVHPNSTAVQSTIHPISAPPTYPGPDIEVAQQPIWDITFFQPAEWDPLPATELAAPFNEPAFDMDFSNWNLPLPIRMQESAERGGTESSVSAGLVFRLNRDYPDVEVDLPYLVETLDSYWSNVAPSFPFIHRGTLEVNDAPSELVLMMVITGSVHLSSPRVDYRQTVLTIRGALTQRCGLDMPISTLQAYTLCHVYDTWYGTSESLFVAQCTWPVMVAHSRRKGIGVIDRPGPEDIQGEEAWTVWAKDEERRRAAFCVLLLDTQVSAFWNQHPCRQLPIFAHNIALPCPKAQWDAMSAIHWLGTRERIPSAPANVPKKRSSSFLPGLHPDFAVRTVSEGYSSSLLCALVAEEQLKFGLDMENKLGAEMVLIGLMAVAWDCRTRGGMGLKLSGTKPWRDIVLNGALQHAFMLPSLTSGVINMRAVWETNVNGLGSTAEVRDMRDTFAISIISVLGDV